LLFITALFGKLESGILINLGGFIGEIND